MAFFHIDNINNSLWQFDEEKTDGVWTALLSLGRIYQLGESTRLSATIDFSHQLHNEFRRLDNSRGGGSLTLSKKLGLGPSTPWIQGGFSVANTFSRSDVRDGQVYSASVRLGKRIAERVDLDLGYTFDLSDSVDSDPVAVWNGRETGLTGDAFDQQGHKGDVRMNFLATNNMLLTVDYSLRRGEVTSTCTGDSFTKVLNAGIVTAATTDDVFGGCAYRSDATTNAVAVDVNQAFWSGHASLNFGYEYRRSDSGEGIAYRNNLLRVTLSYTY